MKLRSFASRKECSALALLALASLLPLILIHASENAPHGGILYFVNTTSDAVVAGACANGLANCSLRGAMQAANSHPGEDGIEIDLPAGSVINLTGVLPDITESVSITGPGPNVVAVQRSSGGLYRIFTVTVDGFVTISGLRITNAAPSTGPDGGGIQNANSGTVNVVNCLLTNNGGNQGGAIANASGGIVNVTNSKITGNNSNEKGGGIFTTSGVTITNSTISFNNAHAGGGVYISGVGVSVTGSTLTRNSAIGNDAGGGGVFVADDGAVSITNSTLSGNMATGTGAGGGGISNDNSTLQIVNCTVSGNSATSIGGGIDLIGANANGNVRCSIIAQNSAPSGPDVAGSFTTEGYNLLGADGTSGFINNVNNDQVGSVAAPLDPKLDPNGLQDNGGPTQTIALLLGSPAIDKGTNGLMGNLMTDQRGTGFARTLDYSSIPNASGGNGTDVGAFEFGGPLVPISVSRKVHGAMLFDIALPLTGNVGIECRTGGASGIHQLVMNFPAPVSLTSASVTTGAGSVSNFTVNGAQVTVTLTGVANSQTIVVTLFGVSDGTNTGNVAIPMGVLLGDTNGNRSVNSTDVSETKSKSGQAVSVSNFRTDVTVSNSINSTDVSTVKLKSGTALP